MKFPAWSAAVACVILAGAAVGSQYLRTPPTVQRVETAQVPVTVPDRNVVCPGGVHVAGQQDGEPKPGPSAGRSMTPPVVGTDVLIPGQSANEAIAMTALAPSDPGAGGDLVPIAKTLSSVVPQVGASRLSALRDSLLKDAPATAPFIVTVGSDGKTVPLVGGMTTSATPDGDLRGVAAAPCSAPSPLQYIVGGSTNIGHTARLVMVNPFPVATSATLKVFGPQGVVELQGAQTYAIAPLSRREVLLGALAPGQPALGVEVSAPGGGVVAYISDSELDGVQAAGIDTISATAPPEQRVTIPGVLVDAKHAASVRIVNPSDKPVAISMMAVQADGRAIPLLGMTTTVAPGAVIDQALAEQYPIGLTTLVVTGDSPVLAAVQVRRNTTDSLKPLVVDGVSVPGRTASDRFWVPAPPALGTSRDTAAVASFPTRKDVNSGVFLSSPPTVGESGWGATLSWIPVYLDGSLGDPQTVNVAAGKLVSMTAADFGGKPAAGALLWSSAGELHATMTAWNETGGGVAPLWPAVGRPGKVSVYPVPVGAAP